MTMTTDLTALLPRSADHRQELLVSQLRDGWLGLILIGLSEQTARRWPRPAGPWPANYRDTGLFTSVNNGDPADFTVVREVLMRHRYLLSAAVTPEHFTATALREAFDRHMQILASPAGALLEACPASDPTGEVPRILAAFTPGEGRRMRQGVW
ncbi:MAG: hypothetical protein QM771_00590 [Nitrospira sp.]